MVRHACQSKPLFLDCNLSVRLFIGNLHITLMLCLFAAMPNSASGVCSLKEVLGSRKSVRRGKLPLPASYDLLLQLFGKHLRCQNGHELLSPSATQMHQAICPSWIHCTLHCDALSA